MSPDSVGYNGDRVNTGKSIRSDELGSLTLAAVNWKSISTKEGEG